MKTRTKITIGTLMVITVFVAYIILSDYEHTDIALRLIDIAGLIVVGHHGAKAYGERKNA